jgi:hypothetical protein
MMMMMMLSLLRGTAGLVSVMCATLRFSYCSIKQLAMYTALIWLPSESLDNASGAEATAVTVTVYV